MRAKISRGWVSMKGSLMVKTTVYKSASAYFDATAIAI